MNCMYVCQDKHKRIKYFDSILTKKKTELIQTTWCEDKVRNRFQFYPFNKHYAVVDLIAKLIFLYCRKQMNWEPMVSVLLILHYFVFYMSKRTDRRVSLGKCEKKGIIFTSTSASGGGGNNKAQHILNSFLQ